mmetsp:Transcript_71790/g.207953  ORF Transcript_71790/g.207953 Transcript_71790/m.207953 type:complete len:316 (-) Transcript_71790:3210-4157(-)
MLVPEPPTTAVNRWMAESWAALLCFSRSNCTSASCFSWTQSSCILASCAFSSTNVVRILSNATTIESNALWTFGGGACFPNTRARRPRADNGRGAAETALATIGAGGTKCTNDLFDGRLATNPLLDGLGRFVLWLLMNASTMSFGIGFGVGAATFAGALCMADAFDNAARGFAAAGATACKWTGCAWSIGSVTVSPPSFKMAMASESDAISFSLVALRAWYSNSISRHCAWTFMRYSISAFRDSRTYARSSLACAFDTLPMASWFSFEAMLSTNAWICTSFVSRRLVNDSPSEASRDRDASRSSLKVASNCCKIP